MKNLVVLLLLFSASALANTLTEYSFGKIVIGMKPEEALKILKGYSSDKLNYEESYSCYYLAPKNNSKAVYVMVESGIVSRFDVMHKELNVKTSRGIGIGSNKLSVLKAYPNTIASPHRYIGPGGEYLEVELKNGNRIIFETDKDIVTSFRLGSNPAVGYIEGCL